IRFGDSPKEALSSSRFGFGLESTHRREGGRTPSEFDPLPTFVTGSCRAIQLPLDQSCHRQAAFACYGIHEIHLLSFAEYGRISQLPDTMWSVVGLRCLKRLIATFVRHFRAQEGGRFRSPPSGPIGCQSHVGFKNALWAISNARIIDSQQVAANIHGSVAKNSAIVRFDKRWAFFESAARVTGPQYDSASYDGVEEFPVLKYPEVGRTQRQHFGFEFQAIGRSGKKSFLLSDVDTSGSASRAVEVHLNLVASLVHVHVRRSNVIVTSRRLFEPQSPRFEYVPRAANLIRIG